MKTISFINQKGGVGKTTSASEIAARLAIKKNVLAIDCDPQANLSYIFGVEEAAEGEGLQAVFDGSPVTSSIVHTSENVDLIPNSILMAAADHRYVSPNAMLILKKALKEIEQNYDYCVIDAPPALGIISWNVLIASDYLVVPVNANALSIQGLKALSETIDEVTEDLNPGLTILGLLITRFNPRTNMAKEAVPALDEIANKYLKTRVFNSKIRQSVAIEDAQASKHTLANSRTASKIKADYDSLYCELVNNIYEVNK